MRYCNTESTAQVCNGYLWHATIDGTIDSVWDDAPTIDVNTFSVGNGATGTAKMLWDENNLYVLTEVTDPVLSKSSANAYEQDDGRSILR
ncbi:sugar-binding protein [Ruminococcus sp.]|uniref:sugar-binding protein n=1 Tax=Ruminococcus sp. TaxID=41978 RepID=UPI003992C303